MTVARALRLLRTALLVGGFFIVGSYSVRSFRVAGTSMEPTLLADDHILATPLAVHLFGIRRGDIVVFHSPLEPGVSVVKRVVAVPGDTVRFESDDALVDVIARPAGGPAPVRIQEGFYFVVGDNRPESRDSRYFGPLAEDAIRGKVFFRYLPWERRGVP